MGEGVVRGLEEKFDSCFLFAKGGSSRCGSKAFSTDKLSINRSDEGLTLETSSSLVIGQSNCFGFGLRHSIENHSCLKLQSQH